MGQLCHNGCRAGAGAAAHTGGDEHHVRPFQDLCQGGAALLSGLLADLGLGACTHAVCQLLADLHLVLADGLVQVLLIRIHGHKFHTVDTGFDHPVDNIIACAADTDHLDLNDAILNGFRHTFFPPMYLFAV